MRGAVGPASPSGHYVKAPAAAFFRSLRVENSRNPARERRYADFSDTLHFLADRALLVGTLTGTNAGKVPVPRPP